MESAGDHNGGSEENNKDIEGGSELEELRDDYADKKEAARERLHDLQTKSPKSDVDRVEIQELEIIIRSYEALLHNSFGSVKPLKGCRPSQNPQTSRFDDKIWLKKRTELCNKAKLRPNTRRNRPCPERQLVLSPRNTTYRI